MRAIGVVAVSVAVLAVTVTPSLATPKRSEPGSANPFGQLFPGPGSRAPITRPLPPVPALATRQILEKTGPSVACGRTKSVPVDPAFDAEMRRPAPTTPSPSMRTTGPCRAR